MYVDYVSAALMLLECAEIEQVSCAQKNLPKVTAPGKLIYVDDGL